jgi:hypothetical protein
MPYPLDFNGGSFVSRATLARWLAGQTGRSLDACRVMLSQYDDDPAVVLARYQAVDSCIFAQIGTRVFRSRADFIRHLVRFYLVHEEMVRNWLRANKSADEILALAKEHHRAQPGTLFPNPRQPVTLFGWRFRSFTALCSYYRRGRQVPPSWREAWRKHVTAGRPITRFGPLLLTIAEAWRSGLLDERNRYCAEIEQGLRNWLPLNADGEPEPVTSQLERALVDALQPPEIDTWRRDFLRQLAKSTTINPKDETMTELVTSILPALTRQCRDFFPTHPAAECMPRPAPDEYERLRASILRFGLQNPLTLHVDADGKERLLDGRTRITILEELGIAVIGEDGRIDTTTVHQAENGEAWSIRCRRYEGNEPDAFVARENLHRRHLSRAQQQGYIAQLLKRHPDRSDRSISELAQVHHETVASIRKRLATGQFDCSLQNPTGEIRQLQPNSLKFSLRRLGRDGKVRTLPYPAATAKIMKPTPQPAIVADIDPAPPTSSVNIDAMSPLESATPQPRARNFVGIIEQIANEPLSPEEFEQLTASDLDTRCILRRSLRPAHDRLGQYLRYFQPDNDQ